MEVISQSSQTQLMMVGLEPGEMLLESLQKVIESHGVKNGVVVSGIGTLKTCRMHYILHTRFPPEDEIMTLVKPLELVSVNGLIANGEPHLHITVSCGKDEVYAGHLEPGSEVLYLAEIAMLVFDEPRMIRRVDQERKVKLLKRFEP